MSDLDDALEDCQQELETVTDQRDALRAEVERLTEENRVLNQRYNAIDAEWHTAMADAALWRERVQLGAGEVRWWPVSEPPSDNIDTDYLGWDGIRYQVVTYKPDAAWDDTSWPWRDWYDDDASITHYAPLPAPPIRQSSRTKTSRKE